MNTNEVLTATTTKAYTFHVGRYTKVIPAGSLVEVRTAALESGDSCIYARLASNRHLAAVLPVTGLLPA